MYTIAICTFDRCELVQSLLAELVEKVDLKAEIMVVENSTSDRPFEDLKKVISDPRIVLQRSAPPGLSSARNYALDAAKFDVVAFLDDDAIPHASWFPSILRLTSEDFALAGGPVFARWPESGRPAWLPDSLLGAYSVLDLGSTRRRLEPSEHAIGANLVVRRSSISGLRFSTELGRVGASLISGEEVAFQDSLTKSGARRIYVPDLAVDHIVSHERVSQAWLRRRMFAQGISEGRARLEDPHSWAPSLDEVLTQREPQVTIEEIFRDVSSSKELSLQVSLLRALASHATVSAEALGKSHYGYAESPHRDASGVRLRSISPPMARATIRIIDHTQSHGYLFSPIVSSEVALAILPDPPWRSGPQVIEDQWHRVHAIAQSDPRAVLVLGTLDPFVHQTELKDLAEWQRCLPTWRAAFVHRIFDEPGYFEKLRMLSDAGVSLLTLSRRLALTLANQGVAAKPLLHPLTAQSLDVRMILTRGKSSAPSADPQSLRVGLVGELRSYEHLNFAASVVRGLQVSGQPVFVPVGSANAQFMQHFKAIIKSLGITDRTYLRERTVHSYRSLTDEELLGGVLSLDAAVLPRLGAERTHASATLSLLASAEVPVIAEAETEVGDLVERFRLGVNWSELRNHPAEDRRDVLKSSATGSEIFLRETDPSRFARSLVDILEK